MALGVVVLLRTQFDADLGRATWAKKFADERQRWAAGGASGLRPALRDHSLHLRGRRQQNGQQRRQQHHERAGLGLVAPDAIRATARPLRERSGARSQLAPAPLALASKHLSESFEPAPPVVVVVVVVIGRQRRCPLSLSLIQAACAGVCVCVCVCLPCAPACRRPSWPSGPLLTCFWLISPFGEYLSECCSLYLLKLYLLTATPRHWPALVRCPIRDAIRACSLQTVLCNSNKWQHSTT